MKTKESALIVRLGALALAAVSLAGCDVYPAGPAPVEYGPAYAVPGPGYGGGYGYGHRHYWYNHRGPGHGHW